MPTYEYKCPAGHVFEKFYPTMNYKRREKCPTCGKPAERQISGGAGLRFQGARVLRIGKTKRWNSSTSQILFAAFCLKKKTISSSLISSCVRATILICSISRRG